MLLRLLPRSSHLHSLSKRSSHVTSSRNRCPPSSSSSSSSIRSVCVHGAGAGAGVGVLSRSVFLSSQSHSMQTRSHHDDASKNTVLEEYGTRVFDRRAMRAHLLPRDYDAFISAVSSDQPVDASTADAIAQALLSWAQAQGATHYTHWFQPILEGTASKHDTFLDTLRDGETPIFRLSGKQLLLGEPDGSSFPSGGQRGTHHARGYTAWDPHSPPFLLEHQCANSKSASDLTLFIPSFFFSWNESAALDEKIPLLRSELALRREAVALLKQLGKLGEGHNTIHTDSGLEQEFFIIKREYYNKRIDLISAGRTVLGAAPPKGQELEDQYFGAISDSFLTFIKDLEDEAWKVGIPVQTRHREVAPGQYEIAPKFAPGSVATDRNLVLMELLKRVSRRHNLAVLLAEKPFKGVNGSGKHNNWSLGSNSIGSLLTPGDSPATNTLFLLFLASIIRAIDVHGDLMRIAISGAGNDHRLGANEAPPAIVSVYLGDDIEQVVLNRIAGKQQNADVETRIDLGIPTLPKLNKSPTDRNRTSTFAFTGNKFEFRAVGASQNPSRSNQVLNTIIAESLNAFAKHLAQARAAGVDLNKAIDDLITNTFKQHQRIIFNGNGYSAGWQVEAKKRGLPNLATTPDAIALLTSQKNVDLYERMKVLTKADLESREIIYSEEYTKKITIESNLTALMASTLVLPAALKYQTLLSSSIIAASSAGVSSSNLSAQKSSLDRLSALINQLSAAIVELKAAIDATPHEEGGHLKTSRYALETLIPAMNKVRTPADDLEGLVPDWPIPTYQDMLFHQD